ncbi:MAG: hypothetical protein ABJM06_00015 [Gilvibacter sp.]
MTRIKLLATVFSLGLLFIGCEAESLDEALETQNANLTITKSAALDAQQTQSDIVGVSSKSGDDDDKPGMDDDGRSSGDDDDKPGMDDDGRSSGDDDDKPGMDDDGRPSGDDDDKPGMDDDGRASSQKSGDDDDKPGMDDN